MLFNFKCFYEVKPLIVILFKDAMETRASPISIGDSCFLSLVVIYSFYGVLNSAMFINVYHSRRVCKRLKSFFACRLRMTGLLR